MSEASCWPASPATLIAEQQRLATAEHSPWMPPPHEIAIGACFVCFPRGQTGAGAAGDPAWGAAVVIEAGRLTATATTAGTAGAPYEPGLLALREGPLLEQAVRALDPRPDVLLVDATGRDHPRRAGLALHLGAVLGLPTVGVTNRLLVAHGEWPADERGARSPFEVAGELAGYWLRTRRHARPLAIHAAYRTDPELAAEIAMAAVTRARTPEPLRQARRLARLARASAQ